MNYENFFNWLINEKNMSKRAAKDVISRCKRLCKILNITKIENTTIEKLNNNMDFLDKSMFIKSQLRRACALWNEFGGK